LKSPRARLFVALDLPDPIREGLARWQHLELDDPALRPVKAEALHVTLCFLSYHPEKAIDRILELIEGVGPRPIGMQLEPEPVPIPGGRPRLFAVGTASEAAEAVQQELSDALEAERLYEPEKRPFWPHLTVARVRSERRPPARGQRRGRGRPKRVEKRPGEIPKTLTEPFGAVRVALYRSNLKPQGAEYVRLGGVDLPSP
jgi:RNA 2',3'-cyclic 3'-phosphodiesterase